MNVGVHFSFRQPWCPDVVLSLIDIGAGEQPDIHGAPTSFPSPAEDEETLHLPQPSDSDPEKPAHWPG